MANKRSLSLWLASLVAITAGVTVYLLNPPPRLAEAVPSDAAIGTPVVVEGTKPSSDRKHDFNKYVLKAVDQLYAKYKAEGYEHGAYFTHDLDYSAHDEIKASKKKPKTMCVAAVAEVMITAIHLYADEQHDTSVYTKLPAHSWSGTSARDIRPYIFQLPHVRSNGPPDALEQFGLGELVPFQDLQPGDFIGFNRKGGSGHAVVFLAFIDASGDDVPKYDAERVVGFKFFSSQGAHDKDGGLGYRWGYFAGHCPKKKNPARHQDCTIDRSDNQKVLNTGYMFAPSEWKARIELTPKAVETQKVHTREAVLRPQLGRPPSDKEIETQLSAPVPNAAAPSKFDGVTIDEE
jgi:hypothetical protein